ncbi:MAG: hypothetical protein RLY31_1183 [Bacteroidota bacterium]
MMKRKIFTYLLAILGFSAAAQLNMTLLDQLDYTQNTNDIWGWVDPDDSTEYALVGTVTGVSVVSLADPENIQEVAFLPGANSTWRDIKTWGDYAYVINESSGGLMVINLTDAPNNITATNWSPDLPGLGTYTRAHNLYIDEFGYCYISGANVNSGGMIIVDVFSTPGSPQFVAAAPPVYAHDVYVRENMMYASEIYLGRLGIYDVSDKEDIVLLATQQTPYNFTHNAWLNDAGDVVFTTDEKANAPVAAYDISDLGNISELDQFRPVATLNANVIPHNVHVWQDWLIISYYTDGGVIVDASRPENLIEVGNWDTFLGANGGFSGAWGAYPFLPSGLVLLTDIGNGLFVCGADYVRACWVEGKVTSSATGLPILGAAVHIESTQANTATTDPSGEYQTGQALAGVFDVTFTATGYLPKTVSATLENGELTILDVELDPISSFTFSGQTVRSTDGAPVAGAKVFLQGDQLSYDLVADADGQFSVSSILGGTYDLYAGAWGYRTAVVTGLQINQNTPSGTQVSLVPGYADDFVLDLGWTETHTASSGVWVRGVPVGTTYNNQTANPGADVPGDLGAQCYMTGNGGGAAGDDDVDNGVVTLRSPLMDLTGYNEPVVHYRAWFFNAGGSGNPNDALEVRVTNGTQTVVLETVTQSQGAWRPEATFPLAGLLDITPTMQIIFETSDLANSGHLVEAALDAFHVEDAAPYPPFSASATSGCSPLTVQFTDNGTNAAAWSWEFPGGTPATSDISNPTVTYTTAGTFPVILHVVTDEGESYTLEQSNLISVSSPPQAGFIYSVDGPSVVFDNTSAGDGSFFWSFGDGGVSDNPNPLHTYATTGIFSVTLVMENACGIDSFVQDILILVVPPQAGFSANTTAGCAPLTVQFADQSTGNPDTWNWEFPGGTPSSSMEQNPAVTYEQPGTYSVLLTVSNGAGNSEQFAGQLIQVGEFPTAAFSFTATDGVVDFTNLSLNASSYSWDFGDGTGSQDEAPNHTYEASGIYEVTLTAFNDCGFAAVTETIELTVVSVGASFAAEALLQVSPNPFDGEATVRFSVPATDGLLRFVLFNSQGAELSETLLQQSDGSFLLGDRQLAPGTYFGTLFLDGLPLATMRMVRL